MTVFAKEERRESWPLAAPMGVRTDMSDDQPKKVLVDAEVVQRNDRYNELVNHLKSLNDDLKKGREESEICLDAVVAVK